MRLGCLAHSLIILPFSCAFLSISTSTSFGGRRKYKSYSSSSRIAATGTIDDNANFSIKDTFNLIVLGDLHLEDDMSCHEEARDDCLSALKDLSLLPSPPSDHKDKDDRIDYQDITVDNLIEKNQLNRAGDLSANQLEMLLEKKRQGIFMNSSLVSLGDLGRKDIRHEPGDAGTTKSFVDAKDFLDGFSLPYDLVTGNHDLEGLDEFDTDEGNLQAWMDCFEKDKPYFAKQIGERTLLIGLSTVRFRDSPHSSHECHADDEQLEWFDTIVEEHSHEDGWRICVFTHAPIMGSGLRVLQNVHVINGCAWMNHCSPSRSIFINSVKENPQIKLWCSGHFHLSHDFEDSISQVNQCAFVQVGVVGRKSTRDEKRQTRIVQGNSDVFKIYTINHHLRDEDKNANLRLDATIDLESGSIEMDRVEQDIDRNNWFRAYRPEEEDGCYIESPTGTVACEKTMCGTICWWHMSDDKVLGVHEGQMVEYDTETLSPLGIVVTAKEMRNREVLVVDESKVLVLLDPDTGETEVIHPNEDGSYWRKYQRNKRIRLEEKARETAAKLWMERHNQK